MKKGTKICAVALSAALIAGTVGILAGCGGGDPDTFTIWMGSTVNSEYFDNYGSNPAMQYLAKKFDLTLKFVQPVKGNEEEDFNKLIGSDDYPDMMDLSYYKGVVADLYDDGYGAALDLTQYIADYMPNYTKFLADNSELTKYSKVDGKYLTLNNYNEAIPEQWGGFMYRRDLLVKANDTTYKGSKETTPDGVYFPDGIIDENGYDNPLTIADWEYMFGIFKAAGCDYAITLPNDGYYDTGDIVSAWGNGGGLWNLVESEKGSGVYDKVELGATQDSFKAYAQKMHDWYTNGWLDPNFTSHGSDMFFALDGGKITSGKVGMFYGTRGWLGHLIETSSTQTPDAVRGIDVWGARQPKLTKDSPDPTVFYLDGQETARRWIVTDKAKKKNLDKFFKMLDYLYTEEGAILKGYGLTKEQWEESGVDTKLMTRFHLDNGGYCWADDDWNKVPAGTPGAKVLQSAEVLNSSGDLLVSICGQYFFGVGYDPAKTHKYVDKNDPEDVHRQFTFESAYREWGAYVDNGTIRDSLRSQMTSKEGKSYNTVQTDVITEIGKNLPKLIKNGFTDRQWLDFVGGVRTAAHEGYKDENTKVLQAVIDRLKTNG